MTGASKNAIMSGEIVFIFIEHGVFGKQDSDKLDDFGEAYAFEDAFKAPFLARA